MKKLNGKYRNDISVEAIAFLNKSVDGSRICEKENDPTLRSISYVFFSCFALIDRKSNFKRY